MITDYSEASEREINVDVARSLGFKVPDHIGITNPKVFLRDYNGCMRGTKDYVNVPNDAWPIIINNSISIVTDGVSYTASDLNGNSWCTWKDKRNNPLLAAMIVFLMMREVKYVKSA